MAPLGPDFIRAIEERRAVTLAQREDGPPGPVRGDLLVRWIHHDNMLEGRLFQPTEIEAALSGQDEGLDRYLHPLLKEIRRYRDAIEFVTTQAHQGPGGVNLNALKAIHKLLTPQPKDRGGLYRRNSPVHRDYYQRICAADKVPYNLRKLFELIDEGCDQACDPIGFAAEVHHRLMVIYPFRRNPGTTARLFNNLLLASAGYPPLIIQGGRRREYYDALCRPDSAPLAELFLEAAEEALSRDAAPA